MKLQATNEDRQALERCYAGRRVFHGELHNHAATGGTSDGKCPLSYWREAMTRLDMDFVAILDHRQVRHMYLPEWEDGLFVCGTEPGTKIVETGALLHYNLIFPTSAMLEKVLSEFPEFAFTGGPEGHYSCPDFTVARFGELMDAVRAGGGFFVIPHPKQIYDSDNPEDFYFRDETGIEVFYVGARGDFDQHTAENYALWRRLLAMGKRVWACAGGDTHTEATDRALTTFYSANASGQAYLDVLRRGDFVCGNAGIRMCVGDTPMGGVCDFAGKRLILAVSDFHRSVCFPEHRYRVTLLAEEETVFQQDIFCTETAVFALDAAPCRYYRAEVTDLTANRRIAIGNPIWNR